MLNEFIDFVDSVLPSVDPDFRDGAKKAITQFEKEGHQIKYLTQNVLEQLSQGDVVSKIPFFYFDKEGKQKIFSADALVLSTSCHIDQKESIIMVPVLPLDAFTGNMLELKRNTVYDYMYIPDEVMSKKFVNFQIANTYNKELIMTGLREGRIKRIASLNQIGYYLFVVKLTVYFMRKEDEGTLQERANLVGC